MKPVYVLCYEDGSLAGMDRDSGGYPFKASLGFACFWYDLEEVRRYMKMFPELSLYKFNCSLELVAE